MAQVWHCTQRLRNSLIAVSISHHQNSRLADIVRDSAPKRPPAGPACSDVSTPSPATSCCGQPAVAGLLHPQRPKTAKHNTIHNSQSMPMAQKGNGLWGNCRRAGLLWHRRMSGYLRNSWSCSCRKKLFDLRTATHQHQWAYFLHQDDKQCQNQTRKKI